MKYLVAFLLLFITTGLIGQRIPQTESEKQFGVEQISLANPYVGAVKLSYNFDSDKPLNDNLLFSANVQLTPIQGKRFAVPIVGIAGLGSTNLLDPSSGLNIGIYPYYLISQSNKAMFIAHGGLSYKKLADGSSDTEDLPSQVKAVGGLEVVYGEKGSLPTTISAIVGYLTHPNLEDTAILELTFIVPVAEKLAILGEFTRPFSDSFGGQFRAAVITTF